MTTPPNQSLEDATVALIASDPEIRDLPRQAIKTTIARWQDTIEWGSPDARLSAMKAVVPGMMRSMGRVEMSENDKLMREAYERMRIATGAVNAPEPVKKPVVRKKAAKKAA